MPSPPPTPTPPPGRPPHVAYIAWGFPPSRAGGVYRQLATANALAADGWAVTVVTVERRVFTEITGADESLEERIDPRIEVLRTAFDWPLRNRDRAAWPLRRRVWPRAWRKARVAYERAIFPEVGYATWLKTLRSTLAELHRRQPIDLTLASGNPHVAFAAAEGLRRDSGVPFVMDYRDAWLLNVFTGRLQHSDRSRAAAWERRLIAQASQVWFVNQDILDWHAARYPAAAGRFRLVPNGWDPDLFQATASAGQSGDTPGPAAGAAPPGSAPGSAADAAAARPGPTAPGPAAGAAPPGSAPGSAARPLTFGYLGTLSANAPIAELIAGWREAKRTGLIPPESELRLGGYLGYFGGRPDPARDPLAATVLEAAADGVRHVGRVDKTAVGAFYAALDALVLPIRAGRYVTSGKVYEYAATAKPIVSIHPPEAGAARVLEGYPLWAASGSLAAGDIAAAFGRGGELARGLTAGQTAAAAAFARRLTRARALGPAVAGLRELLPGGSRP